jgi:Protein of unknown function (DUF3237)
MFGAMGSIRAPSALERRARCIAGQEIAIDHRPMNSSPSEVSTTSTAQRFADTQEREAMSYEKIFEYDLDITGVTDYGADMEALFTGRERVPLQGAQFDVTLAGSVKGRVTGAMRGVDYLRVRPDGRRELELRGTIETDDGSRIAFSAEGVGSPRDVEPIVDLAVKIDLLTAAAAYSWLNAKPAWGSGYANLATNKIHVDVYVH